LQAHLKTAQAIAQTKVFKRACKANPKEKEILKNAPPHDKKTNESKQNRTYKPRQTRKHWW
jgi:hypothetical protein